MQDSPLSFSALELKLNSKLIELARTVKVERVDEHLKPHRAFQETSYAYGSICFFTAKTLKLIRDTLV
jgi:hypothetical protein